MILYPLPGELFVDFHRRLSEATEKTGGIPADPDWMGGDEEESRAFCGQDEMGRFTYGNDCGDEDGIPDGAKQRTPTKAGKKGGGKKAAPKIPQPPVERPGLGKEMRWKAGDSLMDLHSQVDTDPPASRSEDGKTIEKTSIPDAYVSQWSGREFIDPDQVGMFLLERNDRERGKVIDTTEPLQGDELDYMTSSIENEVRKALERGIGHAFYSPDELKKQIETYSKIQPLILGGKTASGVDLSPEAANFLFRAAQAMTSPEANPFENLLRVDQALTPFFNDPDPANARLPHPDLKLAGASAKEIKKKLVRLQAMADQVGWDELSKIFTGPAMRQKDFQKFFEDVLGMEGNFSPNDVGVNHVVPPFAVFGPKVGPFFANNNGQHEFLTADVWFTRTWGRVSGELIKYRKYDLASKHGKALASELSKMKDDELEGISRETFKADVERMKKTGQVSESIDSWASARFKSYGKDHGFEHPNPRINRVFKLSRAIVNNRTGCIDAPYSTTQRQNMDSVMREVASRVGLPVAYCQDILWQNEQDMWGKSGSRTATEPGVPSLYSDQMEKIVADETYRRKPWESSEESKKSSAKKPRGKKEKRSAMESDYGVSFEDRGVIEQYLFDEMLMDVPDDVFAAGVIKLLTRGEDKESRSACEKQADGKFATGNDCAAGDGVPIDRSWRKADDQLAWDSDSLSSSPPAKSLASARTVLIPAGRTLGKSLRIIGVSMDDVVKVGGASEPDSEVVIGHGDLKNVLNLVDSAGEIDNDVSGMVTVLGKRDVMGIKSAVAAAVTVWRDADDEDKLKVSYEFIGVSPEAQEKASIAVGRGMMKGVVDSITSAARMGADEVTMFAAGNERNKEFKGYRIWPRVGFDGVIPRNLITHTWTIQRGFFNSYGSEIPREALSPRAKAEIASGKLTIQALYETPAGQKWWESHGGPMNMAFRPGDKKSAGWKRFVKYRDRLSSRSLDELWEVFCGESDIESRAFCPTGDDGGVDNSCGSDGVSGPLKGWGKTDKTERYTPDEKSFSGGKHISEIKIDEPKKVRDVLDAVKMTLPEAIQASGAPGDAIARAGGKPIKIAMARDGSGVTIDWSVEGGGAEATRHISPDGKGGVRLGMGGFFIDSPELRGRGIALDALARSVSNPAVSVLYMSAERFDTPGPMMMIGYKHWPKYGFNAPISLVEKVTKKSGGVPKQFSQCKDLLDVYDTPGGPEWWAENGSSIHLTFDNKQRSKSRELLLKVIRKSRDKFGGG